MVSSHNILCVGYQKCWISTFSSQIHWINCYMVLLRHHVWDMFCWAKKIHSYCCLYTQIQFDSAYQDIFFVLFATFYHFYKGFSSSLLTFPLSGITCKIMSVNITYNLNLKVNLSYFTQNENEFDNNRSCLGIYLTYLSPT